jgi:D-lactate dehydrogenase
MNMKIGYVTPYDGEKEILESMKGSHEFVYHESLIDSVIPETLREVDALSLFVNSRLNEAMIDSMPNLKVIALRSMGYDHVPVAYAQSKGIVVTYVPRYGAQTVAEHAFALMLSLSRKPYEMYDLLRRDGNIDVAKHEGFDLCGKTIGVVGTGNIGRRVVEIAKGFRMNVVAFDVYQNNEFAKEMDFPYLSFEELLAVSDIVTFHVPATPENQHMLNAETIAKAKDGIYVINTARGTLIDTVALLQGLKSGKIGAAGLDVFEGEEYLKDEMKLLDPATKFDEHVWRAFAAEHELLDMPNVIITPHMAFNTVEAKREITETTVQNINAAVVGTPQNVVTLA